MPSRLVVKAWAEYSKEFNEAPSPIILATYAIHVEILKLKNASKDFSHLVEPLKYTFKIYSELNKANKLTDYDKEFFKKFVISYNE